MIDILIADADPATRKALSLLLRRKLCLQGVYEVADVESLIRTLANNTPELLLLDSKLYGLPLIEACRLLQKEFPQLRIVLLSLDANDEEIAKCTGVDFVYKGAAPDAMIAKLTSLLYRNVLCVPNLE